MIINSVCADTRTRFINFEVNSVVINKMETEETLIQLLVKELSCESCSSQVSPPLIQCFFGHRECSRCTEKSRDCNICTLRRNYSRDNFLERLCFRTTLKCSFSNEGCLFSDKALEVAVHEKNCTFGSESFRSSGYCNTVESGAASIQSSEFKYDDCVKTLEENLSKQKADIGKALPGERLEDILTSALQCPVCLTRIIPPIPECTNGHQICFRCCSRVKNCPVCRGQNVAQENRFLVKIFERLDIRCKNAINGCRSHKKGRSIVYHENVCEFAFRLCPLRATDECKWEGFKSDLVDHCMREHADRISSGSENRWELRGFKNQKRPQFNLLYAHGVVFRCGWERYGLSKRFSVNHIVDENDLTSYTFDLKIVKPGTDNVFMVSSGVCFPVSNFRVISVTTSYIVLSKKHILDFCDINGNLSYIIKINKNV